ncbi:MAG: hypothetical protein EPO52_00025 [Herbiconiux sp.]|uniref:hypothetical protein n=1 Tax=Herbiconiux sp. TaxID=1871186 RepID=UPI0011F49F44|nr:hypothetical protein [Herbiconiux sp.]TAJ50250.1 MAG: hypothetical protein EPO52_00025 [Herbiconiux sp.]
MPIQKAPMPIQKAKYAAITLMAATCGCILCGCAMLPISASTTCRDYLTHEQQSRRESAEQIAAQQNSPYKGRMAGIAADAICTSSPERTLGHALG